MAALLLAIGVCSTAASAAHWTVINGTDQRWWIDTDSISRDAKQGVTFFTEEMSDQASTPPDNPWTGVQAAMDCTTAEIFTYSGNRWSKEQSKWPADYWASARRIVCGG